MDQQRFRFGLFEFDAATQQLWREGVLVRLQSQPAQALSCLLSRAGQVVSREDLYKAVWGTGTFVDFDRGLNFCIAQMRSALADDPTAPRYVRTIPRRGYQFIAPVEQISKPPKPAGGLPIKTIVVSCAVVLLCIAVVVGYKLRSGKRSGHLPIVAVVRFDNETNDPGMTQFSDALTDTVVEQLTTIGHDQYGVIGNAAMLRLPRDHRDLSAVASALHAGYVVFGQVQGSGSQTRILAHLVRMPDQTHLWVVRMDRDHADPLSLELDAAQKIATEFSPRLVKDSSGSPLPPFPSH